MSTEKLYYEDPHLAVFQGEVLSCQAVKRGWEILLDATAFYPEGGGQAADTGYLAGVRVLDTRERDGEVVHLCDGPLAVGSSVEGQIDYEKRFPRMQQHTGEHIVSGIIHRRWGLHNTGFHMGADVITIDFDGVIPPEALPEIEAEANRTVWENLPVRCWYPGPEDLPAIPYRTKKALPWPVRLVEVPGADICACCGVHVAATGEIGLIKLFSSIGFRGGSRMEMACGVQALAALNEAYRQNKLVSQALSAKPEETGAAAQRMNELLAAEKYRRVGIQRQLFRQIAAGYPVGQSVVRFESGLDGAALRELAETVAEATGGRTLILSGSDEAGYAYCLIAGEGEIGPLAQAICRQFGGRGGGKGTCRQGRLTASRQDIERDLAL